MSADATLGPRAWTEAMRVLVAEFTAQDRGYPMEPHVVHEPGAGVAGLPAVLREFYSACDGVSLPDIWNGYFIDSAARTATAVERGEPSLVDDASVGRVIVFGSDGGGGRFALGLERFDVYYLPSAGAVRAGVYIPSSAALPRRVGRTLTEFLARLHSDVAAFVADDRQHRYLA